MHATPPSSNLQRGASRCVWLKLPSQPSRHARLHLTIIQPSSNPHPTLIQPSTFMRGLIQPSSNPHPTLIQPSTFQACAASSSSQWVWRCPPRCCRGCGRSGSTQGAATPRVRSFLSHSDHSNINRHSCEQNLNNVCSPSRKVCARSVPKIYLSESDNLWAQ